MEKSVQQTEEITTLGCRLSINNSFCTGSVKCDNFVGGVAGKIYMFTNWEAYYDCTSFYVANSYVANKIEGTNNINVIAGNISTGYLNRSGGFYREIQSSTYWVPEITELSTSTYGTQKNLSNMFSQSQFSGYDFTNVWQIDEGETMPYLRGTTKPNGVNRNNYE